MITLLLLIAMATYLFGDGGKVCKEKRDTSESSTSNSSLDSILQEMLKDVDTNRFKIPAGISGSQGLLKIFRNLIISVQKNYEEKLDHFKCELRKLNSLKESIEMKITDFKDPYKLCQSDDNSSADNLPHKASRYYPTNQGNSRDKGSQTEVLQEYYNGVNTKTNSENIHHPGNQIYNENCPPFDIENELQNYPTLWNLITKNKGNPMKTSSEPQRHDQNPIGSCNCNSTNRIKNLYPSSDVTQDVIFNYNYQTYVNDGVRRQISKNQLKYRNNNDNCTQSAANDDPMNDESFNSYVPSETLFHPPSTFYKPSNTMQRGAFDSQPLSNDDLYNWNTNKDNTKIGNFHP